MGAERLRALLAGEPVDRPAVAAWRHFPQDDQDPRTFAESTLRFQREYDWDLVKVTPAQSYLAELWGARSAYRGDPLGTREYLELPVRSFDDWKNIAQVHPTGAERNVSNYVEAIRIVRESLGESAVVLNTVFSPLSIARYVAGEELFIASVREAPEDLRAFLDVAADLVERVIERTIREGGVDGSYVSLFPAGSGMLGTDEYLSLAEETDMRIFLAASSGWINIAHFHARFPLLEVANHYPVEVVSWDSYGGSPTIADVARRCPGKVLLGGIDQRGELLIGSATAVEESISRVVSSIASDDGSVPCGTRLIIAPGCTVSQTTPHGNLRALRNSVDPLTRSSVRR